jgi:hypothetical protein
MELTAAPTGNPPAGWFTTAPNWPAVMPALCGLAVLVCFFVGLKHRHWVWEPLWLGAFAFVTGLAGTVYSLLDILNTMAALAMNPLSSSWWLADLMRALFASFCGLVVLAGGILASFILWKRSRHSAPDERAAAGPQ